MEVRSCEKCGAIHPVERRHENMARGGQNKDDGQRSFWFNTEKGMVNHIGDYCKGCCKEFDDFVKSFVKTTT